MSRKCSGGWIETYVKRVSSATESPAVYHWWAATTAVAATLKRHIWVDRATYKLYPNLYTVLVGPPAIGKSNALYIAVQVLREAKTVNMLSDRLTMEFVLEKLSKGFPVMAPGAQPGALKLGSESAALLVSSEMSVFITASQFSLMALADLWDSKEGTYGYGTRGKGEWNVDSPCLSLLAGSAQEWLVKSIPADAVGGGFTRRVNFVFANQAERRLARPSLNGFRNHFDLVEDLQKMSLLRGEVKLDKGAQDRFDKYYETSKPGDFDDQATAVYKSSKWANALKVAMCLSASRGDDLIISEADWIRAENMVDKVASDLKYVFRAVGESELTAAGDKILKLLELKGFATKQEILFYCWRDVTAEDLDRILVTFREAGIVGERTSGNKTVYFVIGGKP